MATQFDATARINVDLRGFSQAANEITKSGGSMTRIFQNLHVQLNQLEASNKKVSADLLKLLSAFNQISTAAQKYASAITALNRADTSKGPQQMARAFEQLRAALASVTGLSSREAERLGRTITLYNQMASALQKVARSYQIIRSVSQTDNKQSQAAERQAQAAQRLAVEQQRVEVAAQRAANAQARLNAELNSSAGTMGRFGQSTFAARSSLGEIEQQGRLVLQVFQQIGTVLAGSAISQEQAFAQVSRVVGEAAAEAAGLQKAFQGIAASFPISFEEVARIGQLGAQIGVSANELEDFTKTVARFALTTGVGAEQTTLLLGRIAEMQNVPISQMENLGSAILALGTASAATEEEILRINESIATVGNVFGLSAQAVTGLSAALATLRVRPELARGSLTRVFGEMDAAIQEGGRSLQQLSDVMGMTAKEVVNLRNENPDEFFLSFIKGVQNSAKEAGGFQQVLRGLGINAVRDIDTITRLANNYNVVADSFGNANLEWSKGSELQRQASGIFDTTAARLQNLADEFKNFAAQAGGPFAQAIGVIAKVMSGLLQALTALGPLVPVLGSLTALVVAGGAAWVAYQIILSKTIQSMLATRELQRSLGVSTLSLGTAMQVYRGELAASAGASANLANGLRLANSQMTVGQVAAQRSAASITALGVAQNQTAAATVRQVAANRSLGVSIAASSAATRQAAANTALMGTAAADAVAANQALAASTFASSRSIAASGAAAAVATRQVATFGVAQRQMATTINTTASAGLAGAAGLTALGRGAQAASLGARAASLAFGPWGIAILAVTTLLGPMIGQMFDFTSQADKIAGKAIEAAGGMTALENALKADTEEFRKSGDAIRTYSSAQVGVSRENQRLADSTLRRAKAERDSILATAGSRAELERQANAHGKGAEAARAYLSQLDKADSTIRKANSAIKENSIAIGEQSRQWLVNAAQSALANSKITDGSNTSKKALEQLKDEGVDVGDTLNKALRDPQAASKELDTAIASLNKTISAGQAPGLANTEYGRQLIEDAASATQAKDSLEALQTVFSKLDEKTVKSKAGQELLSKALKEAGQEAVVAGGKIKLTSDNLEDLDSTADDVSQSVDNIAKSIQGFGSPLDAFSAAAKKAMGDSENAVSKFSLSSRSNLNLFLKELDKIAQAQQNWSANLVKISATLGTDIAQGLADLGPEAAPMIQQLANLTTAELEKLKPRLAALGQGSAEELAGGLLKGMASLQGVSEKVRSTIATGLSTALKEAASPAEFNNVVKAYDDLSKQISGKKPKIDVEVAVDAVKAGADISKFLAAQKAAKKLNIDADVLFDQAKTAADFNRVASIIQTIASAKKAKVDIDIDDAPARLSLKELEAWVKAQEVAGLLDAKGKAAMEDGSFRKKVIDLSNLVMGKKATGEFDVNGNGKFNDSEFRRLFEALKNYIAKEKPKFNFTAIANLQDNATPKIGGIIQAMNNLNGRTATAYANTVQTTYRRQIDQGKRGGGSVMAASGGYISGPGGPREDKISAWLSDGEFVVNAAATRKHRALLEKINAKGAKASKVQPYHYANGGMVQADRSSALMMQRAAASMNTAASTLVGQVSRNADRKVQMPRTSMGPVITVNNTYPRDEPTSISVNRSLAYAAALNGTL